MKKNREYFTDKKIDFRFIQNQDDFIVDEIPLCRFKGSGNFLVLHVKKVELTTWDMIAVFAEFLDIPAQKIGYAGLKDKHATTTQYISVELRYEKALKKFKHPQIKILRRFKHNKNIRMGDLFGNRFKINLQYVDNIEAGRIEKVARKISKNGLPNYFGYQRFGRDGDSLKQAKEMIDGESFVEDTKVKNFLISIYQSHFFNRWLRDRVLRSKAMDLKEFELLEGDVYISKEHKLSTPKYIPYKEFKDKKLIPTGLLCGRDVFRSRGKAREIEEKYDDEFLQEKGYRREALVFPSDIECKYDKTQTALNISFVLPKGSYATVFLEAIGNINLSAKKVKK